MSISCNLYLNEESYAENVTVSDNKREYLFGYPCNSSFNCVPYQCSFERGSYKFELWGAGSEFHKNGGYVKGTLNIESNQTLFLFVGAINVFFNAVDIGESNGVKGNGASDVRLSYNGIWSDFDSLKSRIIVAGAGGNNANHQIGDKYGVAEIRGNYGYAGGLEGYPGLYAYSNDYISDVIYPGDPGTQEKGGDGGKSVKCIDGGDGSFGVGGLPAHWCGNSEKYFYESYAGSGGYYGSGASGGSVT